MEIERKDLLNDMISSIDLNYKKLLKIMNVYYDLEYISDFILDLQLYSKTKYRNNEARIWLKGNNTRNMGIKLMLYSINLNDNLTDLSHKEAVHIFNEYISFYALNESLFKVKNNDYHFNISFEVSNR